MLFGDAASDFFLLSRVVALDESSGSTVVVVVPRLVGAAIADPGLVVRSAVVGVGLDVGVVAVTDTVGEENPGAWNVTVADCCTCPSVAVTTDRRSVKSKTVNPAFGSGATPGSVDRVGPSLPTVPEETPPIPAACVPLSADGGVLSVDGGIVAGATVDATAAIAAVSGGADSAGDVSGGCARIAGLTSFTICRPRTSSGICFGRVSALKANSSITSESANSVSTMARRVGLWAVDSVMKGSSLSYSEHRTQFTTKGSEQFAP